jgi:hypothetical protein
MIRKVFCTVSTYWLGRTLGLDRAAQEFVCQLHAPDVHSLPCVHTITRLRELAEVELRHDAGATVIGKARSRAFHAACGSNADAWVSVDDDVEASLTTLDWLLGAIDEPLPHICVAPCLLRRGDRQPMANVELVTTGIERLIHSVSGYNAGGGVRPITSAGFALVAMNRAAMDAIVHLAPSSLEYVDDDGATRLALFHDELSDGKWWGEDRSFFRRVPRSVTVECLITGETAHAGYPLDLEKLA